MKGGCLEGLGWARAVGRGGGRLVAWALSSQMWEP